MSPAPVSRLVVDHVILGVADLDTAAQRLLHDHGLAALPGGRHPGWGTANRIVPLGDSYLELVTVVDAEIAASTPFGRWVAAMVAASAPPLGWVVRSPDIDADAARLGLDVVEGSRTRPDGALVSWRLAGVAEAAASPELPFLIAWSPGTDLPGTAPVEHPAGAVRFAAVEVGGDPARLAAWTAGQVDRVRTVPGADGVRRIRLDTGHGEIALP